MSVRIAAESYTWKNARIDGGERQDGGEDAGSSHGGVLSVGVLRNEWVG
jgi:hypothetical protein